jgi:hypothetical protein
MLPEVITASAGKDSHPTWNAGMNGQITKTLLIVIKKLKLSLMNHHLNKYTLLD